MVGVVDENTARIYSENVNAFYDARATLSRRGFTCTGNYTYGQIAQVFARVEAEENMPVSERGKQSVSYAALAAFCK